MCVQRSCANGRAYLVTCSPGCGANIGGRNEKETVKRVLLYGAARCHKSMAYKDALTERNVAFLFLDIEKNSVAAQALRDHLKSDALKFPTVIVGERVMRNPTLNELDRALAHAGLYVPPIVHQAKSMRFVWFMPPSDAFVSYSIRDGRLVLTHIEVPTVRRGDGVGKRLALEVFAMVETMGKPASISCPYLRKIAASDQKWRSFFGLRGKFG